MMNTSIRKIEINFPVDINLPDGFDKALLGLLEIVCAQYEREHPDRVIWPFGIGAKPSFSKADAAFLGKTADPDAPETGDPQWDDAIYCIDLSEREDFYGNNPHNPDRKKLQKQDVKSRCRVRKAE